MATVVLVGTLDTKGMEYGWLRGRVRELGCEVVLVDAGIGESQIEADVPAGRVAEAAGASLEALREAGDRGAAVTHMGEGAAVIAAELLAAGRVDAVLAVGGSGGSSIAARAVRDLPIGLPKLHRVDDGVGGRVAVRWRERRRRSCTAWWTSRGSTGSRGCLGERGRCGGRDGQGAR